MCWSRPHFFQKCFSYPSLYNKYIHLMDFRLLEHSLLWEMENNLDIFSCAQYEHVTSAWALLPWIFRVGMDRWSFAWMIDWKHGCWAHVPSLGESCFTGRRNIRGDRRPPSPGPWPPISCHNSSSMRPPVSILLPEPVSNLLALKKAQLIIVFLQIYRHIFKRKFRSL